MIPLTGLLLPILIAAVVVFVASSLIHMALQYHRGDYKQLPEEDRILAGLRPAGLTPGLYIFPFTTHKDMKSPAMQEKYKQGPVGFLTIYPSGPPGMGKFLGLWFAYCLLVGLFVAYVTGRTLSHNAGFSVVFHIAGVAAFLALTDLDHDVLFREAVATRWRGRGGFKTQAEACGTGGIILVITTIVKRHIRPGVLRAGPRSYPFRFKGLVSFH